MYSRFKKDIGENTSRRLSRLYIMALSAVAILTISGQILIQNSIQDQQADSHVINLAGSQRYLSQQLVKFSILINHGVNHKNYKDKVSQLDYYLKRWIKGHNGLQFGDRELNLPGKNSNKIMEMFRTIDPYYRRMVSSIEIIIAEVKKDRPDTLVLNRELRVILNNEDFFFRGMDSIVHQYDAEARSKVDFLKAIETILLCVTLIILLLEGFFIFRPAAKKIQDTIQDLIESENRANNLALELKLANINLRKSLKDLKDVNFALDKATILAKTDRYGIITYVNEKFCEILQYSPEELIGQRFGRISSHYHSKAFFDQMWEVISEGKVWNKEIQNQAKDGTNLWMDVTIVPVLDHNGSPESYIAIYTDVTARFRQSINEQKIRSISILEGQEKERKNLSRELHDGLGQMLTALKFNFEGIKGSRSKKEQEKLLEIRMQIAETIQETRKISFNLMPSVLNDYGLVPAIRHLSDQLSKHSDINIKFECQWENRRLGRIVEINLYRIVQEALNNAVKYAEADEVKIEIDQINDKLRLQISDNGKGFMPKNSDKKRIARSGNGILNIQERTDLLNGDFRIQTAPGEGTRILIKIPLAENVYEQSKNYISG